MSLFLAGNVVLNGSHESGFFIVIRRFIFPRMQWWCLFISDRKLFMTYTKTIIRQKKIHHFLFICTFIFSPIKMKDWSINISIFFCMIKDKDFFPPFYVVIKNYDKKICPHKNSNQNSWLEIQLILIWWRQNVIHSLHLLNKIEFSKLFKTNIII